ncbi:Virginiamycin B lyase [Enhygromyxa salina]|uniref:Virginiamycin B lyase n=2 Tax=Enhygromyxa salina TaxID=215803 RepID=A0A2S9YN47_9BACT|nr:Virginiamycin B lyase [Enhygromyxa salina]
MRSNASVMHGLTPSRLAGLFSLVLLAPACGGGARDSGNEGLGIDDGIDDGIASNSDGDTGSTTSTDTGPKFDTDQSDSMGMAGDCGEGGGGGMMGMGGYSYIWISNSPEGTVSKINTKTTIEEARYRVGPGVTDPSRTSVNLFGDAVVVDRNGGITKIAVLEDRCVETNGQPGIQTSTGPNDVLAWGQDECVLWRTELAALNYQIGARPVAWEGGLADGCPDPNPRVWVGWYDGANGHFRRLDGSSGAVLDSVGPVPWSGLSFGPYGGATDKDGNFWVSGWQAGPLIRINASDLSVQTFQIPATITAQQWNYGMALDKNGDAWIASAYSVYHFHANNSTWTEIPVPGAFSLRGLMVDKDGTAWVATNDPPGLAAIDTATETVLAPSISIPGSIQPVGVSIDVDGYVWVVDQSANSAFKIDGDTYQLAGTTTGLNQPYTYSDMTGAGLDLVTFPPPE